MGGRFVGGSGPSWSVTSATAWRVRSSPNTRSRFSLKSSQCWHRSASKTLNKPPGGERHPRPRTRDAGGGSRGGPDLRGPEAVERAVRGPAVRRDAPGGTPAGVDPCGERGELHTFCYRSPDWSDIAVNPGDSVEREGFWFCDLYGS